MQNAASGNHCQHLESILSVKHYLPRISQGRKRIPICWQLGWTSANSCRWWSRPVSNRQPPDPKSGALPPCATAPDCRFPGRRFLFTARPTCPIPCSPREKRLPCPAAGGTGRSRTGVSRGVVSPHPSSGPPFHILSFRKLRHLRPQPPGSCSLPKQMYTRLHLTESAFPSRAAIHFR